MASSFPTPPPSRIDGHAEKSSTLKERFPRQPSPWETACQKRRGQLDPELLMTATKLVDQVLAKVVAEECLRLPIEEVRERGEERKGQGEHMIQYIL